MRDAPAGEGGGAVATLKCTTNVNPLFTASPASLPHDTYTNPPAQSHLMIATVLIAFHPAE